MPTITYTKNDNLRYTLSPTRQELVYKKLQDILPGDLSKIFLKPKIKSGGIDWIFPYEDIEIIKSTIYSDLSEEEKSIVSDKLNSLKDALMTAIKKVPELSNKISNIYDIPSLDSAKMLQTNKGDFVVISDWAHVRFDKAKGYAPFEKLINRSKDRQELNISFIYSDGAKFESEEVTINYRGYPKKHITDNTGRLELGKLPIPSSIEVLYTTLDGDNKTQLIQTIKDKTEYTLTIPIYTTLTVNVYDQNGEKVEGYPVIINTKSINKKEDSYNGQIVIQQLIAGHSAEVIDGHNTQNSVSKVLERENNEIELYVNIDIPPAPPDLEYLSFYVYDYNDKLIKDSKLTITQSNSNIPLTPTKEGRHYSDKTNFQYNKKVKAAIEYDNNGKQRTYSHKLKLTEDQDEYHLKLKRNYWWLLLLLIPFILLLLLSLKKDITVELKDYNNVPKVNTKVELDYSYKSLYNFSENSFLTVDYYEGHGITDSTGVTVFDSLSYTVYDRIFHMFRKVSFSIITNDNCIADTLINDRFYKFSNKYKYQLDGKKVDMKFQVKSRRTNEIITNANVDITYSVGTNRITADAISNNDGIVTFESIPLCGHLDMAIGSKQDYFPDTISNKNFLDIYDDIEERTLYLNEPLPCEDINESGNSEGGIYILHLPKSNEDYYLHYDFGHTYRDRIILFEGKNIYGKELLNTGWQLNTGSVKINPSAICRGCDYVCVMIEANDDVNTEWTVELECP